ncbi:MAG: diaminopimelate decarboxylase [Oligoflexia bacterium]|nr:diaminopimelate decarboxylase [Oligoflexia bacterium]
MSKPLDHFHFKDGFLSAEGVSLVEVADATGTPVYVYSAQAFLEPLRKLGAGLRGVDHRVCFAVKSNSNLSILRMLAAEGAGMDIVSGGELFRAERAGVPGDRIVFSGVGKTPGEIAAALSYDEGRGIFSFNVESLPELELINAVALELGKSARIALRFNPDVNAKTHPYISTGLKKNKFGMDRREILSIAAQVDENPSHYRGISIHGVGVHIGSQLLSLAPLQDAFTRLRELLGEIERKAPSIQLEFVDLGGGLGISYAGEKAPSIEKYCALIRKIFDPKKAKRPLKLLIEPGRLISGNSGVLLSEVLFRKSRPAKDFLIIDAAMNDLARPALYGSHHEIIAVEKKKNQGTKKKADVVGPVCETGDCFGENRGLGAKIEAGDLVAILSSGAYGFTMSSNYNSRPRPPEVLIQNGSFEIIRERESYDDLIRGETTGKMKG